MLTSVNYLLVSGCTAVIPTLTAANLSTKHKSGLSLKLYNSQKANVRTSGRKYDKILYLASFFTDGKNNLTCFDMLATGVKYRLQGVSPHWTPENLAKSQTLYKIWHFQMSISCL